MAAALSCRKRKDSIWFRQLVEKRRIVRDPSEQVFRTINHGSCLILAFQNILLRGQYNSESSSNPGNFITILIIVAGHNPLLQQNIGNVARMLHTYDKVHNSIFKSACLTKMDREGIYIGGQVLLSTADETRTTTKTEQLSAVLRIVLQFKDRYTNGFSSECPWMMTFLLAG